MRRIREKCRELTARAKLEHRQRSTRQQLRCYFPHRVGWRRQVNQFRERKQQVCIWQTSTIPSTMRRRLGRVLQMAKQVSYNRGIRPASWGNLAIPAFKTQAPHLSLVSSPKGVMRQETVSRASREILVRQRMRKRFRLRIGAKVLFRL